MPFQRRYKRPNKPWFYSLWSSAWECPPKLQPEGSSKKYYIDYPLTRYSAHPELVAYLVGRSDRKKRGFPAQTIGGDETTGCLLWLAWFLVLLVTPLGLIVLFAIRLQEAKNKFTLFSDQGLYLLQEMVLAGVSFRTIVILRVGRWGYRTPYSILWNLYLYPAIICLYFTLGFLIEQNYTLKDFLILGAAVALAFVIMRTLCFWFSMGLRHMRLTQIQVLLTAAVQPIQKRFFSSLKQGLLMLLAVAGAFIGFFILMFLFVFWWAFTEESGNIYLFPASILFIAVILRLFQPRLHRYLMLKHRKMERRLLRETSKVFYQWFYAVQDEPDLPY